MRPGNASWCGLYSAADGRPRRGPARTSADDSQPRRRVRRPTGRACASLYHRRSQPRCRVLPSARARCDGRPVRTVRGRSSSELTAWQVGVFRRLLC
jgi:hypothetical protein